MRHKDICKYIYTNIIKHNEKILLHYVNNLQTRYHFIESVKNTFI